jgi:phage baseplate assembly protein W
MAREPDFLGTGWAFPVRISSRGSIEFASGGQDVEQAIRIIISTPVGERRMRPTFGCAVHDLTFATNDPTTHGLIRYHVLQALTQWEPRIELGEDDIHVSVDEAEPSRVLIEIQYRLRATNERRNLVYPFYLIPGER